MWNSGGSETKPPSFTPLLFSSLIACLYPPPCLLASLFATNTPPTILIASGVCNSGNANACARLLLCLNCQIARHPASVLRHLCRTITSSVSPGLSHDREIPPLFQASNRAVRGGALLSACCVLGSTTRQWLEYNNLDQSYEQYYFYRVSFVYTAGPSPLFSH